MPDRELGGYTNSNAMTGGGPSLREIAVIISPAVGVIASVTEQTFTVPGVLASDRLAYLTPTTGPTQASGTSQAIFPIAGRVSAISVVSIPYFNANTTVAQPTTSITMVFGIAAARVIP